MIIQPIITGGSKRWSASAHDPLFGPLVGFGLGGINVEVLGDVRFQSPLTDCDADDLLHEIRGFPLLAGHRGRPAADIDALRDIRCACRASRSMCRDRRGRPEPGDRARPGRRLPGARRAH